MSRRRYNPPGAPFPLAPGRPRSDWLYGQRMSRNFYSIYQPGEGVNDPYVDSPWAGTVRKLGGAAAVKLAKDMANRALANPRARFGGEVQ